MYILLIARGIPSKEYPMNGVFEFDQARALAREGVKVVYAGLDLRSIRRKRKWGLHRETLDGVEVYNYSIPLGRVPRKILDSISIWALKKLYKKIIENHGKPDIVHGHFMVGYGAASLKDKYGVPLVITEHSSRINRDKIDRDLYQRAKLVYDKADAVIAVSPSLASRLNSKFSIEAKYIPNIVDLKAFKYGERTKQESFNLVSVGNLVKNKRMELLVEAFYQAFGGGNQVNLKIFGQGPEKSRLETMIRDYGLEPRVELMGLQTREDIARVHQSSDCFVLASESETFGLAFIEAMAMGLPVIGTRSGGPEEFINEENGLLIDVNNKDELIKAMKYMLENIAKYKREEISQEVHRKYSPRVIGRSLIDLYEGIIDEA